MAEKNPKGAKITPKYEQVDEKDTNPDGTPKKGPKTFDGLTRDEVEAKYADSNNLTPDPVGSGGQDPNHRVPDSIEPGPDAPVPDPNAH